MHSLWITVAGNSIDCTAQRPKSHCSQLSLGSHSSRCQARCTSPASGTHAGLLCADGVVALRMRCCNCCTRSTARCANELQECASTRNHARSCASDSGCKAADSLPLCASAVLMAVSTHCGLHPCRPNAQGFHAPKYTVCWALPNFSAASSCLSRISMQQNLCRSNPCILQDNASCCRQMLQADAACLGL